MARHKNTTKNDKALYNKALSSIRLVYKELRDMGIINQKIEETSDKIGFFRHLLNYIYLVEMEYDTCTCGLCGRRFKAGEKVIRVKSLNFQSPNLHEEAKPKDYICTDRKTCRERILNNTTFLDWALVMPYSKDEETK